MTFYSQRIMSNKAIYKKSKFSNKSQSAQVSNFNSKLETQTVKAFDPVLERNWIGDMNNSMNTQIQDPRYYTQFTKMSDFSPSKISKLSRQSQYKPVSEKTNKTPTQLIQDILKGLNNNKNLQLNPYYSKDSQQAVIELLSDRTKLQGYIQHLQQNMANVDSDVVKNYQILILLLRQISMNDVQIKQSQQGMTLQFNKNAIQRQQAEIDILKKQLQDRQKQLKEIVDEYDLIIKNFNDVIGKLVQTNSKRQSYQ